MPENAQVCCPCGNPDPHDLLCSIGAAYYRAVTSRTLPEVENADQESL